MADPFDNASRDKDVDGQMALLRQAIMEDARHVSETGESRDADPASPAKARAGTPGRDSRSIGRNRLWEMTARWRGPALSAVRHEPSLKNRIMAVADSPGLAGQRASQADGKAARPDRESSSDGLQAELPDFDGIFGGDVRRAEALSRQARREETHHEDGCQTARPENEEPMVGSGGARESETGEPFEGSMAGESAPRWDDRGDGGVAGQALLEIVRPIIVDWLDRNLPVIAERLIREEMARLFHEHNDEN